MQGFVRCWSVGRAHDRLGKGVLSLTERAFVVMYFRYSRAEELNSKMSLTYARSEAGRAARPAKQRLDIV